MADAQTPVLTDEPYAWHYWNNGGASVWHRGPSNSLDVDIEAAKQYPKVHHVVPLFTHPAPSQPDRAVMQQALDALQTLLSMQSEWHAAFPEHVGDKEAPAMQAALAAIAALSATMEKPNA